MHKQSDVAGKIVFTSDLHVGNGEQQFELLIKKIAATRPDIVCVLGDLVVGAGNFKHCLTKLKNGMPEKTVVLVIAGNHCIWQSAGDTSKELFYHALPQVTKEAGCIWLEGTSYRFGDTAIVGSIMWYDYSNRPAYLAVMPDAFLLRQKGKYNKDGHYLDADWNDVAFAREREGILKRQLDKCQADETVSKIIVCTHMPVFRENYRGLPGDDVNGDPYFYNFTAGKMIASYSKVTHVISGHTHRATVVDTVERPNMAPIITHVVPSDYGRPAFTVMEHGQLRGRSKIIDLAMVQRSQGIAR